MSGKLPEGCDNCITAAIDPGRSIKIVPRQSIETLSEKQIVDYHSYRERFLRWLLNVGKHPEKAEGYSPYTVYESGYRAAAFDRWVWDEHGEYTLPPSLDDADDYMQDVAYSDRAQSSKGKIEEMLKRYTRWVSLEYGTDEWEPNFSFDSGGGSAPRDFLTVEERREIREAALKHGSIPSYNSVSPEQRKRWKGYVAQVLDKPVEDVTPDEWDDIDGWKITSLVWTSLDAGLRPVEVGRAKTSWVDTANGVLRIPREESSKNRENWVTSLTDRTASALDRWLRKTSSRGYRRHEDYSSTTYDITRFAVVALCSPQLYLTHAAAPKLAAFLAQRGYDLDLDSEALREAIGALDPRAPMYKDTTPLTRSAGCVSHCDYPKKKDVVVFARKLDHEYNSEATYEEALRRLRRDGLAKLACLKEGVDYRYYDSGSSDPECAEYVQTEGEKRYLNNNEQPQA